MELARHSDSLPPPPPPLLLSSNLGIFFVHGISDTPITESLYPIF